MKRISGILGTSLAGFAAFTIAAITTTTTEAVAFQATAAKVRIAVPTRMRSASSMHRVPVNSTRIRTVMENRVPLMSINTGPPPTPPVMQPETSFIGIVRVPNDHSMLETKFRAKRRKRPKYFDSKLQHTLDDFNRMRDFWEFPSAIPPEADTSKIPGYDGPDREDYQSSSYLHWGDGTMDIEINVRVEGDTANGAAVDGATLGALIGREDSDGDKQPDMDFGNDPDNINGDNKGNTKPGKSSGTSGDTKPQDDSGGKKPIEDTGGGKPTAEKDPTPEGDDPDEMRNTVQNENLNMDGLRGENASGGQSGSHGQGAPGSSPQRTDSSGWFRRHNSPNGPLGGAGVEDGGPAEMANPMGTSAAGINLSQGQVMSPTVDDQQSGNGPNGPIGPVATQAQSATASVNISSHMTAAMSDPMGSPTVDDKVSGNGPRGPIGPR